MRQLTRATLAALTLSSALGCDGDGAPPPRPPAEIDVLTLEPREVRDTAEYLGSLLSRSSVTVLPQVTGYVRVIHVRPGDTVALGQSLLEIDSRQESAALSSAQAQSTSATAQLDLAQQAQKRAEALYHEGLASAEEVEQRKADVDAREAALQEAKAQVSQRSVQLQYHIIRAAVPGTVGDVLVRVGDYVTATQPLTNIAQSQVLELSVAVPTHRARQVHPGQTNVEVLDRGGEVLITSTLFFVAPEASARTQLVEVKAVFENTAGLRANELVRTRIVFAMNQALEVPVLAVTRQSGQAFVFAVIEKNGGLVVERRPVTIGPPGERSYVVLGGLSAGDRIAVSSLQSLRDGMPITIKGAPKEAPQVGRQG